MFENRAFNTALLVSLLWHLTCIAAINIVVLPCSFRMREVTSVSFLGPILEKTALDIMMANKPVGVVTNYKNAPAGGFDERELRSESARLFDAVKKHINDQAEDRMGSALATPFREVKDVPNADRAFVSRPIKREAAAGSGIFGPLADREVLYRPPQPLAPGWADADETFNLELKFFVTAQGEVKEVIPVISSGSAEVDILGIRYIKRWKFAPAARREEEWGSIKIVLNRE